MLELKLRPPEVALRSFEIALAAFSSHLPNGGGFVIRDGGVK